MNLNKIFKIVLIIAIIVIAGSITYYLENASFCTKCGEKVKI